MRKVLALIEDNPKIQEIVSKIEEQDVFFDKRLDDIKKSIAKLNEDRNKNMALHWEALTELLVHKLPSDYSEKTHTVGFNTKEGTVYQIWP